MSGGEAKDEKGAEAEKDEEGAEAEKGLQLSMRACGCYAKCWVRSEMVGRQAAVHQLFINSGCQPAMCARAPRDRVLART